MGQGDTAEKREALDHACYTVANDSSKNKIEWGDEVAHVLYLSIYLSISLSVPHCLDYYSYIISLNVEVIS